MARGQDRHGLLRYAIPLFSMVWDAAWVAAIEHAAKVVEARKGQGFKHGANENEIISVIAGEIRKTVKD